MLDNKQSFGLDIDFLPVGENSRSGDAICLRWGWNLKDKAGLTKEQFVMVVDGGYASNGADVVKHIKKYYGTSKIDVLVNTHPHADHVNGLEEIVKSCDVGCLVIHQPWNHTGLKAFFEDGRVTSKSIKQSLKEGLEKAFSVASKAEKNGVELCECFATSKWQNFCGVDIFVLNPTKEYYNGLLPAFNATPTSEENNDDKRIEFFEKLVPDKNCPLTDDGQTSAENNSGIVLALRMPPPIKGLIMLTGDAGMPALENAVVEAKNCGLDLQNDLKFFQIPHHGSIQNIGPTILNQIFGVPAEAKKRSKIAYVSVADGHDNEHPAKHVINALQERGIRCFMTEGKTIHKSFGEVPAREGWISLKEIPHFDFVEQVHVP